MCILKEYFVQDMRGLRKLPFFFPIMKQLSGCMYVCMHVILCMATYISFQIQTVSQRVFGILLHLHLHLLVTLIFSDTKPAA